MSANLKLTRREVQGGRGCGQTTGAEGRANAPRIDPYVFAQRGARRNRRAGYCTGGSGCL